MELSTLQKLFIEHGFKIEESFELAIINDQNPEWHSGKDVVGIIASKPSLAVQDINGGVSP
jgi:hypothetical protein